MAQKSHRLPATPSSSMPERSSESELKILRQLGDESAFFSDFDELSVPWSNQLQNKNKLAQSLAPSSFPSALSTPILGKHSFAPPPQDPHSLDLAEFAESMGPRVLKMARAEMEKLIAQSPSKQALHLAPTSMSSHLLSPARHNKISTPSRSTASKVIKHCIDRAVNGIPNAQQDLLTGEISLKLLSSLLYEEQVRAKDLIEFHAKEASAAEDRLSRLSMMQMDLKKFSEREVSDMQSPVDKISTHNTERRKEDLERSHHRNQPKRKSPGSSNAQGMNDAARRYAARNTRLHLIHVRIAALIQDQLVSARKETSDASKESDAEEIAGLEQQILKLKDQLSLIMAERQEALSQLERERQDFETAKRFELDELQARYDEQVHVSEMLKERLRTACQLNRKALEDLNSNAKKDFNRFREEFDWMRFKLQKCCAAMIVDEEDRIEAARESARVQEQSTRRAFAQAFQARIAELEEEIHVRDDKVKSLEVKVGAALQASSAAETLLERIRTRQGSDEMN